MTVLVRLLLAPLLPRASEPIAAATGEPRAGLWVALRADRGLRRLLPAVVVVDLVYREGGTALVRVREGSRTGALRALYQR